MSRTRWLALAAVCLIFTGSPDVRADVSQPPGGAAGWDGPPERTLAPVRSGPALRFGTMVGYTRFGGERITTLGATIAGGARIGPLSGELELSHLDFLAAFQSPEFAGNRQVGGTNRLGVTARLDVASLGPHIVGPTSTVMLWLEAGAGMQRVSWETGDRFQRRDVVVGGGWTLDHRFKRPLGFPSRVGWHFGWRATGLERPRPMGKTASSCKAVYCIDDGDEPYEFGLLVTSSIQFSW